MSTFLGSRRAPSIAAPIGAGLGALVVAFVLAGCSQPPTAVTQFPAAVTIVQGNLQSAQAGVLLPTAVVLRVIDLNGAGIGKTPVTLWIGGGGGSVSPASSITDDKGEITAKWTLGPGVATQTLFAKAPGVDSVMVQATGILPTDIIVAQGNNQSAKVTSALTNSVVVRVVGPGNQAMIGITVGIQITGGGGAITPQSAVTNALGEVTLKWTMGAATGPNSATVSALTLPPVTLNATATP